MSKEQESMKYCQHCGQKINKKAVICVHCGLQVSELGHSGGCGHYRHCKHLKYKKKNKWVALLLCLFLGIAGGHKFYEGKVGAGIGYILTGGLFGIGVIVDFFTLLFKENPYYA